MVYQLVESDCPSLTMAARARLFETDESTTPNTVNLARPSRFQVMYCQNSAVADADTGLSGRV